MGLDIALGVVILLSGVRGWFKGFALQAMQLVALIGCVYAASPLRDLARPYGREYLPGIQPMVLDKLLWWSAAVACYVVVSGFGSSMIRMHKKRTYADFEPNRGDQGAGFFLGAVKGAVVAIFLAAGVESYSPEYMKEGGWVGEQVKTSRALALSDQYKPADQIWNAPPVKAFVAQIRREGLGEDVPAAAGSPEEAVTSTSTDSEDSKSEAGRVEIPSTASAEGGLKPLKIPGPALDPRSPRFLSEIDEALRAEGFTSLPPLKSR